MPKYLVSVNETVCYLAKEINANNPTEAEDIYLEMFEDGDIPVVSSDLEEVKIKEIR